MFLYCTSILSLFTKIDVYSIRYQCFKVRNLKVKIPIPCLNEKAQEGRFILILRDHNTHFLFLLKLGTSLLPSG